MKREEDNSDSNHWEHWVNPREGISALSVHAMYLNHYEI
jgi:hypothetical protein